MKTKTKLPKGLMLQEKAEELSYKVYDSDDIYPHVVTPSMGWAENTYEDGVDDYVDLRINAPDGHYQVAEFTFHMDGDDTYRWWVSKTLVKVEDGILDLRTLVKAAAEVREQHGYHGRFLEVVEYKELVNNKFSGRQGYLNVEWGS